MANEIAMDVEELRHLQSMAKRPGVVSFISNEIRNLEKQLSRESVSASSQAPTPVAISTKASSSPALNYSPLPSFSWDQDNDKVKIYMSLEGVQEEKIETVFKSSSVEVKFHDIQGKNYKFAIPKLNKEVVPESCKVVVKPKRVIVTLPKASKGNWLDLHFKEDKDTGEDATEASYTPSNKIASPSDCERGDTRTELQALKPNLDKGKDPMAGIMDLMKNMFEEGDEDMKKTIAKAWSDARSGKAADPMKGFR